MLPFRDPMPLSRLHLLRALVFLVFAVPDASAQCVTPWCNPGLPPQEPAGTTLHPTYFSEIHQKNIGYKVYLPPSYGNEPDRRYPLILIMSGYGYTELYPIPYTFLVNAMIAGTFEESVIVSLNSIGNTFWHDDAQSEGTSDTVQAYATALDEMMPHLEQTYRLGTEPSQRAILGFSMGGYGGFNFALRSGYFRTVVSLDGSLHLPGNELSVWRTSCYNNAGLMAEHNIFNVLEDHQGEASQLRAYIVRANEAINDQQSFSEELEAAGALVQYEHLPTTPHDYNAIMAEVSAEVKDFLSANLVPPPPVVVKLKVLLDGPWDNGPLMNGALAISGYVPIGEPYTGLGYIHAGSGGGEQTTSEVLAGTGGNAIVDWVFIELRNNTNPALVSATRSALLQRDGDVVDMDGRSDLGFNLAPDQYYVAVHHRNHLAIMTSAALPFTGTGSLVDLSTSTAPLYGGPSAAKLQGGRKLMYAGDVDHNGTLRYVGSGNDRDFILSAIGGSIPTAIATGYLVEDVNLDGYVRYVGSDNDRDPILQNIGGSVPTATRSTSVP